MSNSKSDIALLKRIVSFSEDYTDTSSKDCDITAYENTQESSNSSGRGNLKMYVVTGKEHLFFQIQSLILR